MIVIDSDGYEENYVLISISQRIIFVEKYSIFGETSTV